MSIKSLGFTVYSTKTVGKAFDASAQNLGRVGGAEVHETSFPWITPTTVKPTFKELENAPHDKRPLCGHRHD
jgi:hypothetical protein